MNYTLEILEPRVFFSADGLAQVPGEPDLTGDGGGIEVAEIPNGSPGNSTDVPVPAGGAPLGFPVDTNPPLPPPLFVSPEEMILLQEITRRLSERQGFVFPPVPGSTLPGAGAAVIETGGYTIVIFRLSQYSPEEFDWLLDRSDLVTGKRDDSSSRANWESDGTQELTIRRHMLTPLNDISPSGESSREFWDDESIFQRVLPRLKDAGAVRRDAAWLSLVGRFGFDESDPYQAPEMVALTSSRLPGPGSAGVERGFRPAD